MKRITKWSIAASVLFLIGIAPLIIIYCQTDTGTSLWVTIVAPIIVLGLLFIAGLFLIVAIYFLSLISFSIWKHVNHIQYDDPSEEDKVTNPLIGIITITVIILVIAAAFYICWYKGPGILPYFRR